MHAGDDNTSLSERSARARLGYTGFAIVWLTGIEPSHTPLRDGKLSVGRDERNDIVIAARGVSRIHAEIVWNAPLWLLRDVNSTNGTFLNRARVSEAPLRPNDVIRLGDAVGVVVGGHDGPLLPQFRRVQEGLYAGSRFAARLAELERIAGSPLAIVLEGETGVGKEQVARAVHRWSKRTGPLVSVNCAAVPEQLAESELFGHRRGAFTGATEARLGHLRSAERGTLFLDEVLELPLAVQAKLLRALEAREVVPLGETQAQPLDIRVVCAAQRSLSDCVQRGSFRSDLLARLAEYRFVIPPLRDRREDVPQLFAQLLADACGGQTPALSPKLVELLCTTQWPQNVRQLRSVARQMAVLHSHEPVLDVRHFPAQMDDAVVHAEIATPSPTLNGAHAMHAPVRSSMPPSSGVRGQTQQYARARDLADLERLVAALHEQSGHLGKASQQAGISRQRAQRLLERYPEHDPRRAG